MYFINNCSVLNKLYNITFLHIYVVSSSRLDHVIQDQSKTGGSSSTDQHGYHRPGNKQVILTKSLLKRTSALFQSIKDTILNIGKHLVDE